MTPSCSRCKRIIPDADINVATDVAFCRTCHFAHKLSALVHGEQLDTDIDLERPPAGAWYSGSTLATIVGATHRSVGGALGALAFVLFWNGIVSVFVLLALSATLKHLGVPLPDWFPAPKMNDGPMSVGMTIFLWIFLLPFIAIGLAGIGVFLSSLAGRTEVRIDSLEGVVRTGIGPFSWRQRFKLDAIKDVRIDNQNWRDSDGDRQSKKNILIETHDGRQIKFGSSLRDDRMIFVAAAVRKILLH